MSVIPGRVCRVLAVLLIVAALAAGCGPGAADIGPMATSTSGPVPGGSGVPSATAQVLPPSAAETPTGDAGRLLHDITTNPNLYAGRQVTVEGVLEERGQMPAPRFFLRGTAGDLLEVIPWVPVEVIQPPQGGTAPRSMAYFTGRQLRLTGIVQSGPDGAVLQVSAAEEY